MQKILTYIGIPLLIIIIIFILVMVYFSTILNKTYDLNENTVGNGKKSALLVYSLSRGNGTEEMSKNIANTLSENNYTVTMNYPSEKLNYNLKDFDLIIFGTPVYAGKISSSLEKYIKSQNIKNENIILFVTGMLTDKHEEEETMKKWLDSSNSISTIKVNSKDYDKMNNFIENSIN